MDTAVKRLGIHSVGVDWRLDAYISGLDTLGLRLLGGARLAAIDAIIAYTTPQAKQNGQANCIKFLTADANAPKPAHYDIIALTIRR